MLVLFLVVAAQSCLGLRHAHGFAVLSRHEDSALEECILRDGSGSLAPSPMPEPFIKLVLAGQRHARRWGTRHDRWMAHRLRQNFRKQ